MRSAGAPTGARVSILPPNVLKSSIVATCLLFPPQPGAWRGADCSRLRFLVDFSRYRKDDRPRMLRRNADKGKTAQRDKNLIEIDILRLGSYCWPRRSWGVA